MIRLLFLFISLPLVAKTQSSGIHQKTLIGTWQLKAKTVNGHLEVLTLLEQQTFYAGGIITTTQQTPVAPKLVTHHVYRFVNDSSLIIVKGVDYDQTWLVTGKTQDVNFCITTLNDSTLVLSAVKPGMYIVSTYRRIASEDIAPLLAYLLLPQAPPINKAERLPVRVVNNRDSSRYRTLAMDNECTFHIGCDSLVSRPWIIISGTLARASDSTVFVRLKTKTVYTWNAKIDRWEELYEYRTFGDTTEEYPMRLLTYLETEGPQREILRNKLGSFFLVGGAAVSCVLAPLFGIDLANNYEFVERRYYTVALSGIGSAVIGSVFTLAAQKKRFRLVASGNEASKKTYWHLN